MGSGLQLRRVASEAAGNVGLGGAWSWGRSLGGSFGLGDWDRRLLNKRRGVGVSEESLEAT